MEAKPGANSRQLWERPTRAGSGKKELAETAVLEVSWLTRILLRVPFTIEHLHLHAAFKIVTFLGDQSRTNLIDIPSYKRRSPVMTVPGQDLGTAQAVLNSFP